MWRELVRRQGDASGGGPRDSYTATAQTPSLTLFLERSHPSNSNSIANIHHASERSLLKEWSFQAKKQNTCFILIVPAWKLIHADFTGRYRENIATNNSHMIYESLGQKIFLSHTKESFSVMDPVLLQSLSRKYILRKPKRSHCFPYSLSAFSLVQNIYFQLY